MFFTYRRDSGAYVPREESARATLRGMWAGPFRVAVHTASASARPSRSANHAVVNDRNLSGSGRTVPGSARFTAATDVTALAITKLDGTAKGGVVLAIANQFKIPVKFIGVGEKMEDLLVFDKHEFVDSLFNLKAD